MPESQFFTDREYGIAPPLYDEVADEAWSAIVAAFDHAKANQWLAKSFPTFCDEHQAAVVGTNHRGVFALLAAQIPKFQDRPQSDTNLGTGAAMDLIEFVWRYVSKPTQLKYHEWFSHYHLGHDVNVGRQEWAAVVNQLFQRQQLAFQLRPDGQVRRVGSPAAQLVLSSQLPLVGDAQIDDKIRLARERFLSPRPTDRATCLEPLWDVLERVKTRLDSDTKRGISLLISRMASDPGSQDLLDKELRSLTDIGNNYQIRHFAERAKPVEAVMIDNLFVRGYSMAGMAIKALAPGA